MLLHSCKGEASRTWGCSAGAKKSVEWNAFDRARQKPDAQVRSGGRWKESLTVQAHQQRLRKSSCGWKIKKKTWAVLGLDQDVWDGLGVVFIFSISFNPFLLCFLISDYKF
jgi:hypothetical protein|uniref:Uncharacterized protein n=1 Tax=Zea mays TaxID=4577 RepID=A0A804LQR7_MAIZE